MPLTAEHPLTQQPILLALLVFETQWFQILYTEGQKAFDLMPD